MRIFAVIRSGADYDAIECEIVASIRATDELAARAILRDLIPLMRRNVRYWHLSETYAGGSTRHLQWRDTTHCWQGD